MRGPRHLAAPFGDMDLEAIDECPEQHRGQGTEGRAIDVGPPVTGRRVERQRERPGRRRLVD